MIVFYIETIIIINEGDILSSSLGKPEESAKLDVSNDPRYDVNLNKWVFNLWNEFRECITGVEDMAVNKF